MAEQQEWTNFSMSQKHTNFIDKVWSSYPALSKREFTDESELKSRVIRKTIENICTILKVDIELAK